MSEGVPIRQLTIIRIITMSAGLLGSLATLFEDLFLFLSPDHRITLPTALIALVGVLCLLNLLRHLRTLYLLVKTRPAAAG